MALPQNQPTKAGGISGGKVDEAQRRDDGHDADGPKPPCPVDVVDGIPDRAAKPAKWKYVLIGLIFLAWVAFLIYCLLAGRIGR